MSGQTLTEEELAALKQFRDRVRDLICGMDPFASHDLNLVCWLRARDLNVDKAEEMFRKSMKWRLNNNIDRLADDIIVSDYLVEKVPLRVGSVDREGTMVICVPFGSWDLKGLIEEGYRERIFFHIFKLLEIYFQHQQEEDFAQTNMHTRCSIIFDLDQWSMKQVCSQHVVTWAMDFFKQFDAYYPERLKLGYGVNIPKIFEIFWPLVNPFLSKNTLAKARVLGGGPDKWRTKLRETIDPYELPSELGGSNTTHHFIENRFGLSVLSMPRSPLYDSEDFVSRVVAAGDKFLRSFNLLVGNRITWNFKTKMHDIGFQFVLNNERLLFPYAKTDAHICLQDGLYDVVEDGTYTLVFDNSYSRLRSKTLEYVICIDGELVSKP
ncbi:unnamed protein product [Allacma fusca]|uniref:SEC14-like protein 2 n=1 Tax=Allacma fusca TaxID=39272 RepID=A0A8J2K6Z0_9HEXA|nr:unnamed protein product [Allacma fusca]